MSRQRKARAWGVEWARTSDSNWACLSALRDTGCAIGTGMVKVLIVQKGHRNLAQTYLLLFYTLSRPKYTGIGFMKWTSSHGMHHRRPVPCTRNLCTNAKADHVGQGVAQ